MKPPTELDSIAAGPNACRSERNPLMPAARSLKLDYDSNLHPQPHPTNMVDEYDLDKEANPKKLVVAVPEELLATLRTTCTEKANVSLIGRIQGKHPGLKVLTAWARETLHSTLALLSLKTNNLFEVTFTSPEGRIHALTQTELICETTTISFSSWRPHFDPQTQQPEDELDFPVWVQIVDLCQILREESFLRTIGEQIGQVITIDNSEAYRAKLFGPRIRLLVRDLNNLPQLAVLPRLDGEGTVEYKLKYSGLPNQCGRCQARDHQVRHCPKRESKSKRRPQNLQPKRPQNRQVDPIKTAVKVTQEQEVADPLAKETTETPITEQPPAQTHTEPIQETGESEHVERVVEFNEENFPQLQSPTPRTPCTNILPSRGPEFVWRAKVLQDESGPSKGKEKHKLASAESTPLTRQGYRSGRLAEDFWSALEMPDIPQTSRKKLRVIPYVHNKKSST